MVHEDPDHTRLARAEGLDYARHIRSERQQLKRELRAGRVDISRLLADPPDCVETWMLFDMMLEMPRLQRVELNKVLHLCRVPAAKTVGGLTFEQRMRVVEMLRR